MKALCRLTQVFLAIALLIPSVAYALEDEDQPRPYFTPLKSQGGLNLFANNEILKGGSTFSPTSILDGNDKSYEAIGLDSLYGIEDKQTTYFGEVPLRADARVVETRKKDVESAKAEKKREENLVQSLTNNKNEAVDSLQSFRSQLEEQQQHLESYESAIEDFKESGLDYDSFQKQRTYASKQVESLKTKIENQEQNIERLDRDIQEARDSYNERIAKADEKIASAQKRLNEAKSSDYIFNNRQASEIENITGAGNRSYVVDLPTQREGIFKYITCYKDEMRNNVFWGKNPAYDPEDKDSDEPEYKWLTKDEYEYEDLHLYGLTQPDLFLDSFVKSLLSTFDMVFIGVYLLITNLLGLLITLSNFQPSIIVNSFVNDSGDNVLDTISTRVLVNSPLLLLAAVVFIVGLISLMIRRFVKGEGSIQAIFQELGFLLLSALVAAIAVSGGISVAQEKIVELGELFANKITLDSSSDEVKDPSWLYIYKSSDVNQDTIDTQIALSKKPFVDVVISSQFGYSVDQLSFATEDDCQKNFGTDKGTIDSIIESLSDSEYGSNLLSVTNRSSSVMTNRVDNLGYYWYCADSSVNPRHPFDNNGVITGTPNNDLFVIDFLAALDASVDSPIAHSKAQEIVKRFNDPSLDTPRVFLITLAQITTCLAVGSSVVFTMIVKLVFFLGVFVIPVIPIMLLIPSLRSKVRDMLRAWLSSAVKMIFGVIYVTLLLQISVNFCKDGLVGVLLALAFTVGMFLVAPKIFSTFNDLFYKYDAGFAPTRNLALATSRIYQVGNRAYADRAVNRLKRFRDLAKEKMPILETKLEEKGEERDDAFSNFPKKQPKPEESEVNEANDLNDVEDDEVVRDEPKIKIKVKDKPKVEPVHQKKDSKVDNQSEDKSEPIKISISEDLKTEANNGTDRVEDKDNIKS